MRIIHLLVPALLVIAASIANIGAAGEKKPADAEWTKLFAKEDWYKGAEGKEQVFKGKLEAIPNAGGISTLQRTSYYKMGKRTLYTGAKKVPALDKLVGKEVEILGKPMDFELEGQMVMELWPAAVRPIAAKKE